MFEIESWGFKSWSPFLFKNQGFKGIGGPKSIKCKWPSCLNFYWKLSFSNKCCCSVGGSDNKVTLAWTKCSNHITQRGRVFRLIPSLNRVEVEQGGAHCCLFCHRSQNLYFVYCGMLCKVYIFVLNFQSQLPFCSHTKYVTKAHKYTNICKKC